MAGRYDLGLQSMNRLRRSLDELTPSQRATLGLLTVLVVVAAAVAVVAATVRLDQQETSDSTLVPTTAIPPSSANTTATTQPETTTTLPETTTTTSEPATTTTTTTSTTVPVTTMTLRADGVDGWYFGDGASEVLDGLMATLGEPDEDTGWVDQQEEYGICIGSEVRFVRWESFQGFFTDGPSDWGPSGFRHFASYTQSVSFAGDEVAARTADGLALGSPVGDIRALYGQDSVFDDPLYGPVFLYDPPGAAQQWGSVSGLAADDTISSIVGGFACGE